MFLWALSCSLIGGGRFEGVEILALRTWDKCGQSCGAWLPFLLSYSPGVLEGICSHHPLANQSASQFALGAYLGVQS